MYFRTFDLERCQKSASVSPWCIELFQRIWNDIEKISMATAQGDTSIDDNNPNSTDRPQGDQQVMSPSAQPANSVRFGMRRPVMNGSREQPMRGSLDMSDEIATGVDTGFVNFASQGEVPTSSFTSAPTRSPVIPSDHFLATATTGVTGDLPSGSRQSGNTSALRADGDSTNAGATSASEPGGASRELCLLFLQQWKEWYPEPSLWIRRKVP